MKEAAALPAVRPSVEVDLDALCANFRALSAAAPGALPAAVVKCDGYGLGANAVAEALAIKENCRTFFVAYPEEGAALRRSLSATAPGAAIYVFNGPHAETLALFSDYGLTPVLNSLDQATLWARAMPGADAALHIDTGMHRLGAPGGELPAIAALKDLTIGMVISHLACSSDPFHPMNALQRHRFESAAASFPAAKRCLAASSGALFPAEYHYDVTRLGVGLYGVDPFDDHHDPRIQSVARLTAPVVQIRHAAAGESVGYGATHVFSSPRRLAVVPLGYGDGLPRAASNRGCAFLGGAIAPIVGRVSMDSLVLDVTEVPAAVSLGDRAEFFGPRLPIADQAARCGTIAYELLTGLGARVHRRYVWRDAPQDWRAPSGPGTGLGGDFS